MKVVLFNNIIDKINYINCLDIFNQILEIKHNNKEDEKDFLGRV